AGVGDQARTEAEGVLAEGPHAELALRALRVVADGARRSGRDDLALAAVNRGLALSVRDKRAPWMLESAKIQQKKNRDGAIAAVDRLVADYPKAPEADDALLLKAQILESGPDPKSAEAVYLKLAQGYPESDEGLRATWRLGWPSWLRADPRETLQADPPYARAEALRSVGLGDFADEEMDEAVRRSGADPRRLYALSAAYAHDARHFLSLRILRRHFIGLARSAPPALPRAFWDIFYPLGWRAELTDAASRASVDPFLVAAVVREESSFDPQ